MEYSLEQLNYFRICYVAFNLVPVGLRQIFKQEWDFLYKTTPLGEWKDTPQNGRDFYNNESRKSRTKNARYLATIQNDDTSEWDCSCLFFAILYSDSIGNTLSPAIRSAVDNIRLVRNDIAHINEANLTDVAFQIYVGRVSSAFTALGLSVTEIDDVKNQTSFPTEEVENLKKEVRDLKNELDKTKRDLNQAKSDLKTTEESLQKTQADLQSSKQQNKALAQEINLTLESFCFLAFKPPHEVIRRASDIQRLSSKMQQLRDGADRVVSTMYLSGNPGCGKSQLARQLGLELFSQRSENADEMTFVATVNAENIETLTDSYITLGRQLGITEYTLTSLETSKRETPGETILRLHRLILPQVRKYSKWLIVADNVVDLKSVRVFLPQTGSEEWGHGQVLITTQDSSVVPQCAPHTYHESFSEGMREEDAVELLEKLSQVNDREQAKNVAKVLDYQPLALAAAAYYVKTVMKNGSPNYDWRKYLERLTQSQRQATENVLASESSAYPKTTTKVVEMALQRAVEIDEVLRHTFSFFTLCACEVVPLDAVAKFVKARVSDQPEELIKEKMLRSCMILVSPEEEEQRLYLRVHNIVHAVLKQDEIYKQELSEEHESMAEAVKVFKSMLEAEDGNYALLKKLTPHCKSLLEHIMIRSFFPETPFVNMLTPFITVCEILEWLYFFAKACSGLSDVIIATHVVDLARSLLKNVISDTDEEALMELRRRIFSLSGVVYLGIGKYSQAKEFHEESLMIATRNYGEKHSRVAESYNNLGNVCRVTGEYTKAKEFHEKALEIWKKIFGENNAEVAKCYANLGTVCSRTGEYKLAKELYEKALQTQKKIFGEDNADVARTYNNLGILYGDIGEHTKAKELFEKALQIQKFVLGEDNADVAKSYQNLGIVYSITGEYTKGKALHRKALKIKKKIFGEDNADVARSYYNLGNVYRSTGEYTKAREFYEKALRIQTTVFDEENDDIAASYVNLGIVYSRTGEYTKAKELYEKALEIQQKVFGEENATVTTTKNKLADLNDHIARSGQSRENIQLEVIEDSENRVRRAASRETDNNETVKCCNCVIV